VSYHVIQSLVSDYPARCLLANKTVEAFGINQCTTVKIVGRA